MAHVNRVGVRDVARRVPQRPPLAFDRNPVMILRHGALDRVPHEIDKLCIRYELLNPLRHAFAPRVVGVAYRGLATHTNFRIKKAFILVETTDPPRTSRESAILRTQEEAWLLGCRHLDLRVLRKVIMQAGRTSLCRADDEERWK